MPFLLLRQQYQENIENTHLVNNLKKETQEKMYHELFDQIVGLPGDKLEPEIFGLFYMYLRQLITQLDSTGELRSLILADSPSTVYSGFTHHFKPLDSLQEQQAQIYLVIIIPSYLIVITSKIKFIQSFDSKFIFSKIQYDLKLTFHALSFISIL